MKKLGLALTGVVVFVAVASVVMALSSVGRTSSSKAAATPVASPYDTPHSYSRAVAKGASVALNGAVPAMALRDIEGRPFTLSNSNNSVIALVFADTVCPCVRQYNERMAALLKKFGPQGLRLVYVFSNPKEDAATVRKFVRTQQYAWPAVHDKSQRLLKLFNAQCTTETFLIDRTGVLRYHGRIDDNIYDTQHIKERNLEMALVALIAGRPVTKPETTAFACTIPRSNSKKS